MWRGHQPSQIRYNLVIFRMFEIQAPLYWIYILLAGFLTPPLPPLQPNRFFIFLPKCPEQLYTSPHVERPELSKIMSQTVLVTQSWLSGEISVGQVLKRNYTQTNKGPCYQPSAVFLTVGRWSEVLELNNFTAIQTLEMVSGRGSGWRIGPPNIKKNTNDRENNYLSRPRRNWRGES